MCAQSYLHLFMHFYSSSLLLLYSSERERCEIKKDTREREASESQRTKQPPPSLSSAEAEMNLKNAWNLLIFFFIHSYHNLFLMFLFVWVLMPPTMRCWLSRKGIWILRRATQSSAVEEKRKKKSRRRKRKDEKDAKMMGVRSNEQQQWIYLDVLL